MHDSVVIEIGSITKQGGLPASNRAAEPPFGWLEVLAVGFSSKWTNPVWPSGAAVPAAWR
jgi:hypothetical protein